MATVVTTADQSRVQMALAHDVRFLDRLQYLLAQQAGTVMAEVNTTANHAVRVTYAKQVLANPGPSAAVAAVTIVGSTNLVAANTMINPDFSVTTDATDASILAQIATLWDRLSGVAT